LFLKIAKWVLIKLLNVNGNIIKEKSLRGSEGPSNHNESAKNAWKTYKKRLKLNFHATSLNFVKEVLIYYICLSWKSRKVKTCGLLDRDENETFKNIWADFFALSEMLLFIGIQPSTINRR